MNNSCPKTDAPKTKGRIIRPPPPGGGCTNNPANRSSYKKP
nr:MAG TPA: hypothetical protein [Caudoviricetes sp.]